MNIFKSCTIDDIKLFSNKLSKSLKENYNIALGPSKVMHAVSQASDFNNWHTMKAIGFTKESNATWKHISGHVLLNGSQDDIFEAISMISHLTIVGRDADPQTIYETLKSIRLIAEIYCHQRDSALTYMRSLQEIAKFDSLSVISFTEPTDERIQKLIQDYLEAIPGWTYENWILYRLPHITPECHLHRINKIESAIDALENNIGRVHFFAKDIESNAGECVVGQEVYSLEILNNEKIANIHVKDLENILEDSLHIFNELEDKIGLPKTIIMKMDKYGFIGENVRIKTFRRNII
jgi:hypothetical protein